MAGFTRRALLLGTGAVIGGVGTGVFVPRLPVMDGTASLISSASGSVLNDASGLSETPVFSHQIIDKDPGQALVAELRSEIRLARAESRAVNIGAARHSMGGHAIPRNGHAISLQSEFLEADTAAQTYRVQAGVRWASVIAQLDAIGYSPKVMQSNNDFGVAATFCVNAHGWPVPHGPMGATVRSCQMVLASEELVTCSRDENAELFNLAMGGYGLIGLISELEVEMVKNTRLLPQFDEMASADLGPRFVSALEDSSVEMAYGRLNVDRENFFADALLIAYRPDADQSALPPASGSGFMSNVSREIIRGQLGNERIKRWRWGMETALGPRLAAPVTRNSLINEPVITLDDGDPTRTDILHEYFVAPDRFADFVQACQDVIPASYQELLNITLRYVAQDRESLLSYAPVPRIAAVMLFSQEMTARGEADMARMTRDLIDRVLDIGGSYYLPYRLHATGAQFRRAYAQLDAFVAGKRQIDPELRFKNGLWDRYLEEL